MKTFLKEYFSLDKLKVLPKKHRFAIKKFTSKRICRYGIVLILDIRIFI